MRCNWEVVYTFFCAPQTYHFLDFRFFFLILNGQNLPFLEILFYGK